MIPIIIGIVVVIIIVCVIAGIYNNMVTLRNRIDNIVDIKCFISGFSHSE